MINVLVVHEFPLMCNIISSVLSDEPDIRIIGCGTNSAEAMELVNHDDVDVVLVSSALPDQGALTLTTQLVHTLKHPKILILGITETRENVLRYIEAGATGYVLRESSLDDLLTTVRAVYAGKALVSPNIAAALIERVSEFAEAFSRARVDTPDSLELTPRELQVLELLGENFSNQEIAEKLVIEMGTVKNHVHSILSKLGVSNRDDAAKLMLVIKNRLDTAK